MGHPSSVTAVWPATLGVPTAPEVTDQSPKKESPMEHEEEVARLRAEMDQAVEGMAEMARALWALFSQCKEQGFDDAQAMRLTAAWLKGMTSGRAEPEE